MNCYLITCKSKKYATNADNIQEAEDKFAHYFVASTITTFVTDRIEVEAIRDDSDVIWF